jgi:hypothetical protein
LRKHGEDPLGDEPTEDLSKKKLDKLLAGEPEAAGVVQGAIENFAHEVTLVIRRFTKLKAWQRTERLAVGGGLRDSRVGELVVARAGVILKSDGVDIDLTPIRNDPDAGGAVERARVAATALHLELEVADAANEHDLDRAFLTLTRRRPDAILTVADPFLTSQRIRMAAFMIENRLPSIYTYREDVLAGGLISYSTNYYEVFRRAAFLTDKLLKGVKPNDIPVEQPTKFELVINLKTAKALGLDVPPTLLARADEVIE